MVLTEILFKGIVSQPANTPESTGTQVIYVPIYIEVPKLPDDTKPSIGTETSEQTQPLRILSTNGLQFIERAEYLDGCKDILGLSNTVTRSAAAQLLYGLISNDCPANTTYFAYADVPPNSYCAPAISTLSNAGIFCGCNGNFAPDTPLTQAEAVTILARLKGVQIGTVTYGHWAESSLFAVQEYGIAKKITVASLDKPIAPAMLLEMIAALFSVEI